MKTILFACLILSTACGDSAPAECMSGLIDCNGVCVDLASDPLHCGACATACSDVNSAPSCSGSMCVLACDVGFDDCDADVSTGCETDLTSDASSCGACGDACSVENATPSCSGSACMLACDAGFGDCDSDVSTGCEANLATDVMHCGACDTVPAEICDGLDDNCNTTADDGCPSSLVLANSTFAGHSQFGNLNGGSAFADSCAPGSAIHRFSGNAGGNIDRIRAHCAPMVLVEDQANSPYIYTVTRGTSVTLATHGGNVTTPFDVSCPADTFVVGIDGEASGSGLHDLTIHCAPITIDGSAGAWTINYGAITMATVAGGNAGPPFSDLLAAPQVVDSYRGRAGAWVDAIGIGEADVTLTLVP